MRRWSASDVAYHGRRAVMDESAVAVKHAGGGVVAVVDERDSHRGNAQEFGE